MINIIQQIAGYWRDGGWLMIPIALVAFGIWAYYLRLRAHLQAALLSGYAVEGELDAWINGKAERPDWWRADVDAKEARREVERMASRVRSRLQRDVFVLKALTAAAPLLGLLGTVTGMVDTFMAVSRQTGEGALVVADGIHTALITTQFGLVAALPGVFGLLHLSRLRGRWQHTLHLIGMRCAVSAEVRQHA